MAIKKGSYFFCADNGSFVKVISKKIGPDQYRTMILRPTGEVRSGGIFSEKLIREDLRLTPISARDRRLVKRRESVLRRMRAIKRF